jgi:hypothetical protein
MGLGVESCQVADKILSRLMDKNNPKTVDKKVFENCIPNSSDIISIKS